MELNRIYNMDCFEGMRQMHDKSVDLVLTDIPYGECSGRDDKGIRKINKGEADVVAFNVAELVTELSRLTKGSIYMFCGTEQVSEIIHEMRKNGLTTRLCIWEKPNPSPLAGEFLWLSNIECCVFGRFQKATFNEFCKGSVWRCNCGSSKIHPTQKPLELFKRLILASSHGGGDVVLDPFSGSGTTAIACNHLHRNFIAFEKNETFYKASVKRYNEETAQLSLF